MSVCREYGISYSHFMGGPGRWNADDRAKAIAYEAFRSTKCSRCGTSRDDWYETWTDEHGEEHERLLEEPMWAVVSRRCEGCSQWHQMDRIVPQDAKDRGVYLTWIPDIELTDEDDEFFEHMTEEAERKKLE